MPRISMCKADREKYGGEEWLELEASELTDEETGLIELIEEKWGLAPKEFLAGMSRGTVKGIRALIWAARWKHGHRDDPRDFRPRTQEFSGVRFELTVKELELNREVSAAPLSDRAEPKKTARKSTAASKRSSTGTGSGSSGS